MEELHVEIYWIATYIFHSSNKVTRKKTLVAAISQYKNML